MTARMLYTCATPGCEAAGQGFTDEPSFCSLCMCDLAGVYDMDGAFQTDDEIRAFVAPTEGRQPSSPHRDFTAHPPAVNGPRVPAPQGARAQASTDDERGGEERS